MTHFGLGLSVSEVRALYYSSSKSPPALLLIFQYLLTLSFRFLLISYILSKRPIISPCQSFQDSAPWCLGNHLIAYLLQQSLNGCRKDQKKLGSGVLTLYLWWCECTCARSRGQLEQFLTGCVVALPCFSISPT